MPETSGLDLQTHSSSSASAVGKNHKRDADANMNELSENKTVVDSGSLDDTEKGSPPRHPHVITDGGLAAWGTVLGAYVE